MAQKIKQLSNHLSNMTASSTTGSSTQNPDSIPWNPNNEIFPLRSELPKHIPYHPNAPEEAAWVWGEHDNVSLYSSPFSTFPVYKLPRYS